MKATLCRCAIVVTCLIGLAPVKSAVKYWDLNGTTPGAGATPTGTWNTSAANWNTTADGTGAATTFTAGDTAVFSAGADAIGAFNVTGSGTTFGNITNEEGSITISGTAFPLGSGIWTIKSGATLIYTGTSALPFTGGAGSAVVLDGGRLRNLQTATAGNFLGSSSSANTAIVVTSNNGYFDYPAGATILSIIGATGSTNLISGSGSIIKEGTGVLAIAGACTYSGNTIISNGTIRVRTSSNRLPTGTDVFVWSPGALDPGSTSGNVQQINSINGNGNITYSASSTLIIAGNSNSTITGIISDGSSFGRIAKQGNGTLTLSGANTYDGSLTNIAGTTIVTPTGTLMGADGDLVINGGAVNLNNATQTILSLSGNGGTLNLTSGHVLTINPAGSRSFSGAVTGQGSIVKNGVGTTELLGTNNYSGSTTVNAGKLVISSGSTGGGSFSVADATMLGVQYAGANSGLPISDLTIGNSTMEFDFAGQTLPSGPVVNNVGPAAVNGFVTVNAKGFNSTGGPVTLLQYAGAPSGGGSFNLGILPPHTEGEFLDDIANSKVLLTITNADSLVWVSDANGIWDVNDPGNPIWKLTPANIAGEYQENAMQGDTVLFDDTAAGTTSVNVFATVSPFRMTVNNPTVAYSFSGAGKISGEGTLTKSGAGELSLSTSNDFTGGTTLNAGTVTIGASSVFGLGKLVINGGTIRSDSATARTVSTPVDLNGNVNLGDAANTGDLTFNTGAWTVTGASRVINVDTINTTISSAIGQDAAGRGITKTGSGTLSVTAANTFSGGFNHNSGTVRVNSTTALGAANSPVNYADGVTLSTTAGTGRTLTYAHALNGNITLGQSSGGTAAVTLAGSVNLGGAARTITIVNATDTISGVISNGSIVKDGTGILVISGTANTYSGSTTINAGQISISGSSVLGDGTGAIVFAGGKLTVTASRNVTTAPVANPLNFTTDAEITTSSAATTVDANFSGVPSGAAGTVTFRNDGADGANDTFEPRFSAGGFTFSRPIVIDNGAIGKTRLNFFNTNTTVQTFNGVISGNGSVRRSASTSGTGGTTIFTEANTYSGGTTINDGKLLVNNTTGSGTGSGTVTVNSPGTLGGTGSVDGAVVVNNGGSISAGASAGTLTFANGLDLSAGGTNVFELAANSTSNPGVNFDQIVLTGGNLVLGGNSRVRVSFIGSATFPDSSNAFWQSARSWKIISLTGAAVNPGDTVFAGVDGAAGNNAGTFSTTADATGVYLNFTPGVTPPPPLIDPNIVGAGTTSAQVSWSSVSGASYTVQYKTNLNQTGWLTLTNLSATGTTTTIVDNTSPAPKERYYRVISP